MQCKCGAQMRERVEDGKPYQRCPSCTRVFAPLRRGSDRSGSDMIRCDPVRSNTLPALGLEMTNG